MTAEEPTGEAGFAVVTGGASGLGEATARRLLDATDTGGGSSFSMLRTMAATYEIAQIRGQAIHPAQLLWLATEGSARALHLGGVVGSLQAGMPLIPDAAIDDGEAAIEHAPREG